MSATTTQTGNGATPARRGRKPGATPRHRRTRAEIAAAKLAAAGVEAPIPGRVSGGIHATQPSQPSAAVDPAILFVVSTFAELVAMEPTVRERVSAIIGSLVSFPSFPK